jgi:hypothetical protein
MLSLANILAGTLDSGTSELATGGDLLLVMKIELRVEHLAAFAQQQKNSS